MNARMLCSIFFAIFFVACEGFISRAHSTSVLDAGSSDAGRDDAGVDEKIDAGFDAGPSCGGEQFCAGTSNLARISVLEYQQTVAAAFGSAVASERFEGLPSDGRAGPFWSNNDSPVNDDSVAQYRLVAEHIAGTIVGTQATPAVLQCAGAVNDACINTFIQRTARALFRVDSSSTELQPYVDLFKATQLRTTLSDATRVTISALLQSAQFLYQFRTGSAVLATVSNGNGSVMRLSGAAIAARLSYFLWGIPPDDALLAAAARGDLDTQTGVEREARRLLLDAKADRRLGQFHSQWLGLEDLPFRSFGPTQPAGFDLLRTDFYTQAQSFGARVIRQEDATLATLLTANWSMVNPAIGTFYGLTALPTGFNKTNLPIGQRAGILTQAGFLATHLHDASTQAVHRGKAIRELLLCQTIPPPPANIDPRITPNPALSPRQRLEMKTGGSTCIGCHQLMNPVGFTLESFDEWGRFRTQVTDGAAQFAVDATGDVSNADIDGALNGHAALTAALARSETLNRCVVRQWFRFAVARREALEDEAALDLLWKRYDSSGRNLRELIVAITGSDAFRFRRFEP
jgi:hypothetical protein